MTKQLTTQRVLASSVAIFLVLTYVFVSFGYVLPNDTAIARAASPLTSVTSPYFSQRWNVFAPNIIKSNQTMEIQAQWLDDDGERVHGDWIPITEIEQRSVTGSIQPSRIVKQTWNSISSYHGRFRDLNSQQRAFAQNSFIRRDDSGGFEAIPDTELIDELVALGDSRGPVIRFLRSDYMMVRFSALVATAYEDEDITRVRWRYKNHRVNGFPQRFSDEEQYEPNYTTYGWRLNTFNQNAEAVQIYKDMFERQGE